jgi:hypothetical protein
MDTRESRWLPTVIAAAENKVNLVIKIVLKKKIILFDFKYLKACYKFSARL